MTTRPPSTAPDAGAPRIDGPWQRFGWLMAVVWLVFLYFPIRALVDSPAPGAARVFGWCGVAVFTASYLLGFWQGMRAGWRRRPTRSVVGFFASAVGGAALTVPAIAWDATSFLPFLMAYAAYGISTRWHWIATAAALLFLAAAFVSDLAVGEPPRWMLIGIVVMMAAVNTINTWLIDRSVADDELRMELAALDERESVARDVHDILGHSLTVVKLKAELAARLIDRDPAAARSELDEIVQLTGEAVEAVRSTVTGLRTREFTEQLRESRAALETSGVEVTVTGSAGALSPAQTLAAGWILREATTNILRHAGARSVRITISPGTLLVEDDGVGRTAFEPGNGLRGMEARAAAAGAVLDVAPPPAPARSGTRVSLTW